MSGLEGQLTTANGTITTLETTIGSMSDAADPAGSLYAQINHHMGEASGLRTTIGSMNDAANMGGSLYAQINYHEGEATRLSGLLDDANMDIGDPTDAPDMNGSLNAQINYHVDAANGLRAEIGDPADAANENGSLNAQIKYHMGVASGHAMTIGDPSDAPDSSADASLHAQLNAAKETAGSPSDAADDSADASLHAQLNAAKAKIARLEAGTDPSQLTGPRGDASAAKDAADDAEEAADMAADEAEAADDNRATLQTGDANSVEHAKMARKYAGGPDDDADDDVVSAAEAADAADTANTAAQNATNATDAQRAAGDAEDAQDDAEEAQRMAESERDEAVKDSMAELKIDGTVKMVGDTTIDATAGSSVVTVGEGDDAQTTHTGQINGMTPMTTGMGVAVADAVTGVQDDPGTPADETVKHLQAVANRTFGIGKVVDSADDDARLMIITQYAGSKNVYVYNMGTATVSGTQAGRLSLDDNNADTVEDVNNVSLRREGTFYRAGTDTGNDLGPDDEVAADAEGVVVYSYVNPDASANPDGDKSYVVLTTETTTDGTTTYAYTAVDVEVQVAAAGTAEAFDTKVRAAIPEATDYEHIHFGVWASLGEAESDGSQSIADLGIGFVQNFSGEGMTGADMPNNGNASYSGNWAAAVQAEDEDGDGDITLTSGVATIAADFEEGDITVTLDMLATLTGDISGNSFSGTKAEATGGGLDTTADFDGSFSGGFYGAKAAEAGGVFDFASDDGDNEGGAFVGAFGGTRTD